MLRARRERELLCEMKIRKTTYLINIMRHEKYKLPQLILKAKIRRKWRGREQEVDLARTKSLTTN